MDLFKYLTWTIYGLINVIFFGLGQSVIIEKKNIYIIIQIKHLTTHQKE